MEKCMKLQFSFTGSSSTWKGEDGKKERKEEEEEKRCKHRVSRSSMQ